MELANLFSDHVASRQSSTEAALSHAGFDILIISSGVPFTYFADDHEAPFWPTPHFAHWCPLKGPHHLLKIVRGAKPLLVRHVPEDFWYGSPDPVEPFWVDNFELTEVGTPGAAWDVLGRPPRAAYIGSEADRAQAHGLSANPRELTARLDWERSFKSPYEVHCLEAATSLAVRGHEAARAAFLTGASEIEIHHAYVGALGMADEALPFPTIVALDEKGATLHYPHKRKQRGGKVLIIDAGAQVRGYASDITRTHVTDGCDPRFKALLRGMEDLQKGLCAAALPGTSFVELNHQAHLRLAALLREQEILDADPESAVEAGLCSPFLPHGLGHQLGLQVHDVAGRQADPEGTLAPPPGPHPFLRNTRQIEPGQVLTIEPGLYFIPMLLERLRAGEHSGRFNWPLIDALVPLGGIRVEDNLLITATGPRNLTRERLHD
jgi:Xaa-Pro dipeptidase